METTETTETTETGELDNFLDDLINDANDFNNNVLEQHYNEQPPLPKLVCTHQLYKINFDEQRIYYVQEWKSHEGFVLWSCTCPHFHYRLGPYIDYPYNGCKHIRWICL